jgi:hypothetical protein
MPIHPLEIISGFFYSSKQEGNTKCLIKSYAPPFSYCFFLLQAWQNAEEAVLKGRQVLVGIMMLFSYPFQ